MSRRYIDITGQRFGRLIAMKVVDKGHNGELLWYCTCDCGGETVATGANIRGKTRSCGCLHREAIGALHRTHGESGSKLYGVWCGMKQRVGYGRHRSFANYGGRGIGACLEWRDSYEAFRDWALANGYREGLQLERIDNDGDYEPGNCGWVTPTEQANNRRPRRSHQVEAVR